MPSIAVIDDRADTRVTVRRSLALETPAGLSVIDKAPLPNMQDYLAWIPENDISALVLDERLSEGGDDPVQYTGSALAKYLRARVRDLPIFMITAHADDDDLKSRASVVDDILKRTDFLLNSAKYAARIVRAAERYTHTHEAELSELAGLAKKSAVGAISGSESRRLEVLRFKLELPFEALTADEHASQLEVHLNKLSAIETQLMAMLASRSAAPQPKKGARVTPIARPPVAKKKAKRRR